VPGPTLAPRPLAEVAAAHVEQVEGDEHRQRGDVLG
jgi:hypothetical protein